MAAIETMTAAPREERVAAAREAQRAWAQTPMCERLRVLRRFREELACGSQGVAATVELDVPGSLHRTLADTLVAEVLPLADACRFLEREAAWTLRTQRESSRSRPLWMRSVDVEIERVPLGVVLVIGPGNYPLLLPGVQVLQALAAGNAVLWKPAPSGVRCAHAMQLMLLASGLPKYVLTVLDAAPEAGTAAMREGVDKVVLTGSAATGTAVMRVLAETATPGVMELSGCDAVFVLPGADLRRAVEAIAFGLRLNGSATCMAPRRLFVAEAVAEETTARLLVALRALPQTRRNARTSALLHSLVEEAVEDGASLLLDGRMRGGATLLDDVGPAMRVAQTDIFAPLLSVLRFSTVAQAVAMHERCAYALTAAVFGPERAARLLSQQLTVGTVFLNDLLAPSADPRVPFGGRKGSGFGVTRGREGLLAMTAPRVTVRQRSTSRIAYQPTHAAHAGLFAGYVQAAHARTWRQRLQGLRQMAKAMPGLRPGVVEAQQEES